MEFKEIDYILTIAECGSLSKAADKLLMTQPSLSQFHSKLSWAASSFCARPGAWCPPWPERLL